MTDKRERWRRFTQGDHVRLYDRSTRIRKNVFEVAVLDWRRFGQQTFVRTLSRSVRCSMSCTGRRATPPEGRPHA